MPKRTDINSILIIGAGPIVIGQACEFDYSGTQACKALREEGYRVVLVNSNPATIMTDPEMADATYIEPINWRTLERIIEKERPDALLPTMGGQTALNYRPRPGARGGAGAVRRGADRGLPGGHRQGRGPGPVPPGHAQDRPRHAQVRHRPQPGGGPAGAGPDRLSRPSSGPPSPWAAAAAASPTTRRSSRRSASAAWTSRPPASC